MSSATYNYWNNQYQCWNQMYNDHQQHPSFAAGAYMPEVKEEAYANCRYDQPFSPQIDSSLTPPPVKTNQAYSYNNFYPDQSVPSPTSTSPVKDDSPALRALLTKPEGKKITYDYYNLHKTIYQKPCFDNNQFNNGEVNQDDEFSGERRTLSPAKECGKEEQQSAELADVQANYYPWMRSNGECDV